MTRLLPFYALYLAALVPLVASGGPWCFQCHNIFHPAGCGEMTQCGEHESCYAEKHTVNRVTQYSSGCKPTTECRKVVRRTTVVQCSECCAGTLCNEALCQARLVSNSTKQWCAACTAQSSPEGCDRLKLCSPDQACSITETDVWGNIVYDLGCEEKSVCQGQTLAKDKQMCCDKHLCNSNLAGESPDTYTTPPPATTTPPPSSATAEINETTVDYVSHNDPNENLTLTCHVGGYPEPNVTWYFIADDVPASGNGVGNVLIAATPAGNLNSTGVNSTGTTAATGGGNGTTVNGGTTMNGTTMGNTTVANQQRTEIMRGVTTLNGVSTLVITDPDESVAGQYVCHAENGPTPVESNVTVTYAASPVISGTDNDTVDATVREDVLLDCEVEGVPLPEIRWLMPPDAGGAEHLANGSLLLHNVHGDNTGQYLCLANNSVGHASKTFVLNVDDNSTAPCPTQLTTMMTTTGAGTTLAMPSTTSATTMTSASSSTSTTATTTTTTTTQQASTAASTTPLVCPTLPSTTTPSSTTTTTTPTTTTTTPTTTTTTPTTTPTTPTTTTTTPSTTTPTTTSTTPTTTPTTTSTTPTTTPTTTSTTPTTTTPQTTTTTTKMTTPTTATDTTTTPTTQMMPTTSPEPYISAVGSLWHDSDGGMAVLQCNTHARPGTMSVPPITWSRLEENYDHADTKTYTENGHGVLVITPHGQSLTPSGVYQCHVFGGSDNDTSEFAVYKTIPGPIDCRQSFDMGHPSPGVVLRTTCGPCQPAPMQNNYLIWRDQICQSAVGRGLIQQTGGTVAWLIKRNNEVALLKEEDGHVKLIT